VSAEPELDPDISGTFLPFSSDAPFNRSLEQDERGGDNTVEVLGAINILTESEGKNPLLLLHYVIFLTFFCLCFTVAESEFSLIECFLRVGS
jgi:hypothetical protein